jgi:magnesium chelatase family protein
LNKFSGPLLDRIDLHVEVTPVSYEELSSYQPSKRDSKSIAETVVQARKIQKERFEKYKGIHCNAQMPSRLVREVCPLNQPCTTLLKKAMKVQKLSARAYDRILKVARTSADLDGSKEIKIEHLAEAIQYRSLDRETWGG